MSDLSNLKIMDAIYRYIADKFSATQTDIITGVDGVDIANFDDFINRMIEDKYLLSGQMDSRWGYSQIEYRVNAAIVFEGYINQYNEQKSKLKHSRFDPYWKYLTGIMTVLGIASTFYFSKQGSKSTQELQTLKQSQQQGIRERDSLKHIIYELRQLKDRPTSPARTKDTTQNSPD